MKLKILFLLLTLGLALLPLTSFAAIPVSNPGDIFTEVDFTGVVRNIANYIIGFISILGIIFIVYGGLLYVTSAGDEGRAEEGKNTITYAAIGLFVAAIAYAIEDLVLRVLLIP